MILSAEGITLRILPSNSVFQGTAAERHTSGGCASKPRENDPYENLAHRSALPLLALGCDPRPRWLPLEHSPNQPQNAAQVTDDSQDPAMQANLAPAVNTSTQPQAGPADNRG